MTGGILTVGTRFELSLKDEKEDEVLVSQIIDIKKEELICAMPIKNERIVPLSVGEQFSACFFTDGGMFKADGEVKNRWKEKNIYVMSITLLTKLEKFQRREFFRLECSIPAECYLLDVLEVICYSKKHEIPKPLKAKPQAVVISDISGGGLHFLSGIGYKKSEYVYIHFTTSAYGVNKKYDIIGRIIASYPSPKDKSKYEIRLQFKEMSPDKREDIIKFVFLQQRRGRKK